LTCRGANIYLDKVENVFLNDGGILQYDCTLTLAVRSTSKFKPVPAPTDR